MSVLQPIAVHISYMLGVSVIVSQPIAVHISYMLGVSVSIAAYSSSYILHVGG